MIIIINMSSTPCLDDLEKGDYDTKDQWGRNIEYERTTCCMFSSHFVSILSFSLGVGYVLNGYSFGCELGEPCGQYMLSVLFASFIIFGFLLLVEMSVYLIRGKKRIYTMLVGNLIGIYIVGHIYYWTAMLANFVAVTIFRSTMRWELFGVLVGTVTIFIVLMGCVVIGWIVALMLSCCRKPRQRDRGSVVEAVQV